MATIAATKRLNKEYRQMKEEPTPFIVARPKDENILEWHYIISGPPGTPYEGGQYHGILIFPKDYPFKPPGIKMCTPSGRFRPNTRLCLSISDYHPESWNPAWTVDTILTGLLSFMTSSDTTTGSISSTDEEKRKLAAESRKWNAASNRAFNTVFSDYIDGATKSELDGTANSTTRLTSTNGTIASLATQATPESELHKRTHSTDVVDVDKKSKTEVVNLDSDAIDGDEDQPIVLDEDEEEEDFYGGYEPFSSDEGEISDGDGVIVID